MNDKDYDLLRDYFVLVEGNSKNDNVTQTGCGEKFIVFVVTFLILSFLCNLLRL